MNAFMKAIKKELQQLDISEKQLVKFGFLVGGIFLLLSGLAYWHEKYRTMSVVLVPGMYLFFFGAVYPKALRTLYKAWMGLGYVLGAIIGTFILSLLYYILVTPIALAARILKGDPLQHEQKEGSYWIARTNTWTKESMEKMF